MDMEAVKMALRAWKAQEAAGGGASGGGALPPQHVPGPTVRATAVSLALAPSPAPAPPLVDSRGLASPTRPGPASPPGSEGGAAPAVRPSPPPHAVTERFEAVKEMNVAFEYLQLENLKLSKQLQLEKSLKDR